MESTGDISVIGKAFAILGIFDEKHSHLNLSDISRRAELPLTTTHRVVARLLAAGALERTEANEYRIGVRLWQIASLAPRSVELQRIALPFMQDLYETAHYPVHLGIREQHEVVFVARLVDKTLTNARPRVGGRYPIHAAAVGQVLLAYASDDVREEILSQELKSYTPYTLTDPDKLRALLDRVRYEGVATSSREIDEDWVSIAAPIYDQSNEVIAAISIIVPFSQTPGQSLGYLVQAIARGVSRAYRVPQPMPLSRA